MVEIGEHNGIQKEAVRQLKACFINIYFYSVLDMFENEEHIF
jgi:hypothetical protein